MDASVESAEIRAVVSAESAVARAVVSAVKDASTCSMFEKALWFADAIVVLSEVTAASSAAD